MRKAAISIILLIIIQLVSCNSKHDARISEALSLSDNGKADSALSILNKIDRDKLSKPDDAMYCLAYTMAQDKSGIDVDNDSLIRTAYEWYVKKSSDSLYAKCMYYMGKCFALNDSSEKALTCLQKATQSAKARNDYSTQCLALLQQSVILRNYDANKAITFAKAAVDIYNNVKNAKSSNKAYYLLNLAECMSYGGYEPDSSVFWTKEAIKYALQSKDSMTISDSYQDLAAFYGLQSNVWQALKASKKSYNYDVQNNFSKVYALSQFYVLTDSLRQAKKLLMQIIPHGIKDGCALFSLKRFIAMREHDWNDAEIFADSTDLYLDKENSENLNARNRYYSLLLQKEITRTKLSSENQWKTKLIYFISFAALLIIMLLSYIFYQKKKRLLEKEAEKERMHKIEVNHKETQLNTMKNFLLSKIDIVKRLKSINSSEHKGIILSKDDWKEMEVFLNSTDDEFVERLKNEFPNLTQKDLQFLMLVRLKIPYGSIATIYNIEEKSVKQRLFLFKGKLGLNKGEKSTREFIEGY